MELHKISLMDAYMIETLRAGGVTNEEILVKTEQNDISGWERFNDQFDFHELVQLATQDLEAFKSILFDGYQVKFVTFKGLQNLLKLVFNKIEDRDYQLIDTGVSHLDLNRNQLSKLKQMLSRNWNIYEDTSTDITIALV